MCAGKRFSIKKPTKWWVVTSLRRQRWQVERFNREMSSQGRDDPPSPLPLTVSFEHSTVKFTVSRELPVSPIVYCLDAPMTPATATLIDIHGLSFAEVEAWVLARGFKPGNISRLWGHLHRDLATSFDEMTELPRKLRAILQQHFFLNLPTVTLATDSSDGHTRKYLLQLWDQQTIETVEMHFTGRHTACVSSQAGCAMGCVFCATGQAGFSRHLTVGEIVAQVLHVQRALRTRGEKLRNIVLMGMGEPLHNYDAVLAAVDILCDCRGLALGGRRITLSTVGIVPGIRRLADEKRPVNLALSLHGATDADRTSLVPVGKRWPLAELMDACRYYSEKLRRRIFYEWTLIDGVNDSVEHAHSVGRLLQGQDAQVNLIPLNLTVGYDGRPGRSDAAVRFQAILTEYDLPSTVRQRRGIDIAAGCGQLRAAEAVR